MLISTSSRLFARPACSACHSQRRLAHKLVEVQLVQDVPSLGLRGQRVPVSRGLARNQLVPLGFAHLIGTDGKPVSVDLSRRKAASASALAARSSPTTTKKLLDQLGQSVEDPARIAEQNLLDSLAAVAHPISFSRLTTSSTSHDLFGSVSVSDVAQLLRDKHNVKLFEDGMGHFGDRDGVEKGRVKKTGTFDFVINLRTLGQTYTLPIQVDRE
ncbi:hypothetical protein JCM3766R1_001668 [Sporobolomyces carnicolor]